MCVLHPCLSVKSGMECTEYCMQERENPSPTGPQNGPCWLVSCTARRMSVQAHRAQPYLGRGCSACRVRDSRTPHSPFFLVFSLQNVWVTLLMVSRSETPPNHSLLHTLPGLVPVSKPRHQPKPGTTSAGTPSMSHPQTGSYQVPCCADPCPGASVSGAQPHTHCFSKPFSTCSRDPSECF